MSSVSSPDDIQSRQPRWPVNDTMIIKGTGEYLKNRSLLRYTPARCREGMPDQGDAANYYPGTGITCIGRCKRPACIPRTLWITS